VSSGRHLLLVDDDRTQRKLAQLLLEEAGYSVTVADDGQQALEKIRRTPPDAVISDVLMPRLDGFQLCRAIQQNPQLSRIPVVLLSSRYVEEEDRRLGRDVGARAVLERAPDIAELLQTLERMPAPSPTANGSASFDVTHAQRVMRQLELQIASNANLEQQLALKDAELSVLAGIPGMVTRSVPLTELLDAALRQCVETGALSAALALIDHECGEPPTSAECGPVAEVAELSSRVAQTGWVHTTVDPRSGLVELAPAANGGAACAARLETAEGPFGLVALAWADGALDDHRITFAHTLAAQLSEMIALQRTMTQLDSSREDTVTRLALAAEFRDDETARHTDRVSRCSCLLAERLGLDPHDVELIRVASVLHDVGKIGVPDAILLKPGPLTNEEFEQMKTHTEVGHQMLAGSGVELLDVAARIAHSHHERIDGTGYPQGLRGEQIPLEARIVAVADVFDALTSDRVYRPAISVQDALAMMRAGRGTQFDPVVLDALFESLEDVLAIRAETTAVAVG
jgi:putative nucleotidyltransferase with HDIG domain